VVGTSSSTPESAKCEAMDRLLTDESALLRQLLDAASSVSLARDARAQETFTLVATVGGVLIGMPALIIAIDSATTVLLVPCRPAFSLPRKTFDHEIWPSRSSALTSEQSHPRSLADRFEFE
jgi:hypothetical protein